MSLLSSEPQSINWGSFDAGMLMCSRNGGPLTVETLMVTHNPWYGEFPMHSHLAILGLRYEVLYSINVVS